MSPLFGGLGFPPEKGGIPPAAPSRLAPGHHSLPPILYDSGRNPGPDCSKAPRGLSVLPPLPCVFTGNAISPGPPPRQCPNRYAFHAGRNFTFSLPFGRRWTIPSPHRGPLEAPPSYISSYLRGSSHMPSLLSPSGKWGLGDNSCESVLRSQRRA